MANDEVKRFSNSGFKVFQDCLRKYWLSEVRGLGPKGFSPTGPLRSGTRLHVGLEAFYTPGADPFAVNLPSCTGCGLECLRGYPRVSGAWRESPGHSDDAFRQGLRSWSASCWRRLRRVDRGIRRRCRAGARSRVEEIVVVPGSSFAPELVERYGDFDVVGKLDERCSGRWTGPGCSRTTRPRPSLILMDCPRLQHEPADDALPLAGIHDRRRG